jgi:hypothetical protein
VAEGALLQALGKAVVFFFGDVAASFLKELLGAMQAAGVVEAGVYRRMIVQVFAIIDRGSLDFGNSVVDGVDGFLFFVAQFAAIMTFQMSASVAKISERVQIGRVPALRGDLAWSEREQQSESKYNTYNLGDGLHRHEFSLN